MVGSALEWWISTTAAAAEARLADEWLGPLFAGHAVDGLTVSREPLFPLLLAMAVGKASQKKESPWGEWLAAHGMAEVLAIQTDLKTRSTENAAQHGVSSRLQAYTWKERGLCLRERGQAAEELAKAGWFDQAIASFHRALELRPDHPATLNNLASGLSRLWWVVDEDSRKQEILQEAKESILRASELDADGARYNLACVLAMTGEIPQCLVELKELIARDPSIRCVVARDPDFEAVAHLEDFQELIVPETWRPEGNG